MPVRVLKLAVWVVVIAVVGGGLFAGGYIVGIASAPQAPILGQPGNTPALLPGLDAGEQPARGGTPDELDTTFAPFWETWDLVHQEYVDQPVDDTQLMQGAIRGLLKALGDRHSGYMTPEEYNILASDFSGELQGIGAEVDTSGEYVTIISPLPGSPAEAAGILPGDVILEVDGEDMTGLTGFEVIAKVRGPAGTKVHLAIQREGEDEPLEFDIVRAKITIPSVESRILAGDIAYVKINQFGDKTSGELEAALQALMALEPKGLILDLRGNPGGYLNAAVAVASQFVPDGVVMIEEFGDGREQEYDSFGDGLATELPLVVLIDQGSASASEIVAGAIQDYGRGTLVGEQSYGKGTVQDWRELQNDQGAVRITIARWLTPEHRSIHGVGLTPDVEVLRTVDDRAAGRDPQLDEAWRVLQPGRPAPSGLFWPAWRPQTSNSNSNWRSGCSSSIPTT